MGRIAYEDEVVGPASQTTESSKDLNHAGPSQAFPRLSSPY